MGTHFAAVSADELGRVAVNALLARTGLDPALIDEVIFGCVCQPADAINIARVIALRAGIPEHVPAATVHRNCASGFEAVTTAAERIAAGRGSVFIVGGVENMSQVPLLYKPSAAAKFAALSKSRTVWQKLAALGRFRLADFEPRIGLKLGLTDPVSALNMGETAELLARELNIPRHEQDAFALESHRRAVAARENFAAEICPVYLTSCHSEPARNLKLNSGNSEIPRKLGMTNDGIAITEDNGPRSDSTLEALAQLKPVFDRNYGTVTAGNSSQITDGAVALLVMTAGRAAELGYRPLGHLTSYAYTGCDPARMGLGPVSAIRKTGRPVADADIIEINEAFAAQVLAVLRQLPGIARDKLNVNGGSIALGHPVGATGARLVLTALKELQRRNARTALVSLCVGGGQGGALWLERDR
jgi:acetyl-CoA C-acetyltransferase/acetyl-CoA acyltransferase